MRALTCFPLAVCLLALSSCTLKPAPPRTHPLGEKISLGHLVYSAYETQWLTQIGSGPDARIPQNRFFLIRLAITNSGGETIASPNLSIVDDSGNSYSELSDGQGVPQWIGYIRQIAQADTSQGNLVFDVQPKHYKLRITDETGERAALIDLPLEFTSEPPAIQDLAPPPQRKD
jgi:uncharacterized protein (TIGR02588 family)